MPTSKKSCLSGENQKCLQIELHFWHKIRYVLIALPVISFCNICNLCYDSHCVEHHLLSKASPSLRNWHKFPKALKSISTLFPSTISVCMDLMECPLLISKTVQTLCMVKLFHLCTLSSSIPSYWTYTYYTQPVSRKSDLYDPLHYYLITLLFAILKLIKI